MEEIVASTETLMLSPLLESPLPTLPFDLVGEILCRLPVKLLVQLRISTTCDRLFFFTIYNSHVLSYPLHSNFNTVTDNPTRHDYAFANTTCYISDSCDGMFCLEVKDSIILWNPSIQKFKTLPYLDSGDDPAYGFGYDTLIDNYKVVCVPCNTDKINVHTLGTDSWRIIPGDFPVPKTSVLKFVSGTLNWLESDDCNIVSLDLVNESCRNILPPKKYGGEVEDKLILVLDVLRGCLCIFTHTHMFTSVWMMKEYGSEESWTQLFRVSSTETPFYDSLYTKPIWISDDDLTKKVIFRSCEMDFAICDFKNGDFKIQMIQSMHGWFTSKVYIESLVSPCF